MTLGFNREFEDLTLEQYDLVMLIDAEETRYKKKKHKEMENKINAR